MPKDIVNTATAAKILGISQRAVQDLLSKGVLEGERLGREWMVSRKSVEEYKQVRENRGYQPGPKPKNE